MRYTRHYIVLMKVYGKINNFIKGERVMGMYDTVHFRCPYCETRMSAQSKSGDCTLSNYNIDEAPSDVMRDINRHAPHYCPSCGKLVRIRNEFFILKEE